MPRYRNHIDTPTAGFLIGSFLLGYAAWLTSIVFCAANGPRSLLIADSILFPIGVIHGIGVWFGGW